MEGGWKGALGGEWGLRRGSWRSGDFWEFGFGGSGSAGGDFFNKAEFNIWESGEGLVFWEGLGGGTQGFPRGGEGRGRVDCGGNEEAAWGGSIPPNIYENTM